MSEASSCMTELESEAKLIFDELYEQFHKYRSRLIGTDIRLSRRLTSSAGNACPKRKQVGLSLPIFSLKENRDQYRNTVLHELAHIIAGSDVKSHGEEWRSIFLEIGGNGERTHQMRAQGRHRREMVYCESCREELEVGIRVSRRIAKGQRNYQHVGCGGILVEVIEDSVDSIKTPKSELGWFSKMSQRLKQGILFGFSEKD